MKMKLYVTLIFTFIASICFAQEITNDEISPIGNNYTNQTTNAIITDNNAVPKKYVEQPMSLTLLLNGYFPMNNPDEKTGFGGGFRYKYSFLKYFALATSLEYTSIGVAQNHYIDVKAHFMVQRNLPLDKDGFIPYIGIGPSFRTDVSQGNSVMGYSLIAGTQYVWKYLITGFGIDYSTFPQFKNPNQNIYSSDIKVFFEIGSRF